jgi:hypothetical protein
MSYTIKYLGDGNFQAQLHETGEIKECGKNLLGLIRYTYFEDFSYPQVGWEVTQEQLLKDYHPKVLKDITDGNVKPGKHEF